MEMIKLLMSKGASLQFTNSRGETPLIIAITLDNIEAVRYLLLNKVDIHVKDNSGRDACDYARLHPILA